MVTSLDSDVLWEGQLGEANGSGVWVVRRAHNLERWNHGQTHVGWSTIGSFCAQTEVDVRVRTRMSTKPARLEGNGAAGGRPVGTILCETKTTTYSLMSVPLLVVK